MHSLSKIYYTSYSTDPCSHKLIHDFTQSESNLFTYNSDINVKNVFSPSPSAFIVDSSQLSYSAFHVFLILLYSPTFTAFSAFSTPQRRLLTSTELLQRKQSEDYPGILRVCLRMFEQRCERYTSTTYATQLFYLLYSPCILLLLSLSSMLLLLLLTFMLLLFLSQSSCHCPTHHRTVLLTNTAILLVVQPRCVLDPRAEGAPLECAPYRERDGGDAVGADILAGPHAMPPGDRNLRGHQCDDL